MWNDQRVTGNCNNWRRIEKILGNEEKLLRNFYWNTTERGIANGKEETEMKTLIKATEVLKTTLKVLLQL